MSKRELKTRPAGVGDNLDLTYTHFAADMARTELRVGEGKNFDNDELLKMLGFKENAQGLMSLSAASNEVGRENGKVVRRTVAGRTLTEDRQAGMDR